MVEDLSATELASCINSTDAANSQRLCRIPKLLMTKTPLALVTAGGSWRLEDSKWSLLRRQSQSATDTAYLPMMKGTLAQDKAALADTKQDCQVKATEGGAALKSRSEELKALSEAQTVKAKRTGSAESLHHGLTQTSFPQLSRPLLSLPRGFSKLGPYGRSRTRQASFRQSCQLASSMPVNTYGEDPFAKIEGCISELPARLKEITSAIASPTKSLPRGALSRQEASHSHLKQSESGPKGDSVNKGKG